LTHRLAGRQLTSSRLLDASSLAVVAASVSVYLYETGVDWIRSGCTQWYLRRKDNFKASIRSAPDWWSRLRHKRSERKDDEQSERRARRQTSQKSRKSRLERSKEEHTPRHDENVNPRDGGAAATKFTTSGGSTDKQSMRSRSSEVSSALRRNICSSRETHGPATSSQ
jgi:hypothetical protein